MGVAMPFTPSLTNDQRRELAAKYAAGTATQAELAKEYDVSVTTIRRTCEQLKAKPTRETKNSTASFTEFSKRAKKVPRRAGCMDQSVSSSGRSRKTLKPPARSRTARHARSLGEIARMQSFQICPSPPTKEKTP